ncbi:cell surface glycoprotein CD200 receptor 1-A isoform X2 [Parambassis ranga]|uniref:Cell surface glycoprotein CD200 receptor 1-A isoform X2 n=1 Tax=Parambassis ranga TaxID=210632 RepID=A0A6P7HLC9_9TELE|nr:cell surface glycoprotein CD200 receptor 1 isoform X2 [Parambassis ranga]
MMWIYVMIMFLSEAWTQKSGTNESTTVNPSTSTSSVKVYVLRNETFKLGSDVNLTCSSKTWNETLFVIWTLKLKSKECKISFSDGRSQDHCMDGKSLRNTSNAQSYLHIKNFSTDDVGLYECESVYRGGNENHKITVAITVPPYIYAWVECKENKMVAVCKAEKGNPAANISWSHTGSSMLPDTRQLASEGFYTVESRLELSKDTDTKNLSCAIRHPYWNEERILSPQCSAAYLHWLHTSVAVVIIMFLAAISFFAQKKLRLLRKCQQQDISPSKSPQTEDVEDVEPYASYVQRVNSIYNTSSDMFT